MVDLSKIKVGDEITVREFKPGDRVIWGTSCTIFQFVGQAKGSAAVWHDVYGWEHPDLSELRHVDENE